MTAYCPTLDETFTVGKSVNAGFSEEAKVIDRLLQEGFLHYTAPRIESLAAQIEQILGESNQGVDSQVCVPVDTNTAHQALRFAQLLPWSLPMPEVAPEPDGEISFDWLGPSGKMFSVSVNKAGRAAYAGRFGEKSQCHGTEQLTDVCPKEIIRGIARAII